MIAVFDTNAYRKLIEDTQLNDIDSLVARLSACEAEHGITAMMHDITAKELLSHLLDDENSRSYKSCLRACKAMYGHCGNEHEYRMIASIASQIAYEYFGVENPTAMETQKAIAQLLHFIWQNPSKATVELHRSQFEKVKDHVASSEQCLTEEILKLGNCIDPNYTDWHLFQNDQKNRRGYLNFIRSERFRKETAFAMLCAVHIQIADRCDPRHCEPNIMTEKVDMFINSYATALNLRQFFFEQLLNPSFDLTTGSRANYMWDEQILYIAGHTQGDDPITLVTNDRKMLEAAERESLNHCVKSVDNYFSMIGFS